MTTKYGLLVNNGVNINSDEFRERIAVNAYYRAVQRDFEPDHELDDWLEAEREIISQYCYVERRPKPATQIT